MKRLKKDDKVIVLSGNSKGMTGNILRVLGEKVVVQGINVRKKHMKPTQQNPKGSIVQVERPVHTSNVALCVDGKPVKLKAKIDSKGKKSLCYNSDGKQEIYRSLTK
jgi:large subunit ribosomal protein L24